VTQPSSDRLSGRILIADDEAIIRQTLCGYLERLGHTCVAVADTDSAIVKLRAEQFDLLISDIQMPGNEDLALVRESARIAEGMPIILLTGNPTFETARASVGLPVMAYVVKPASPPELAALVKQAVANSRAHRALRASRKRLADWSQDLEKIEEALRLVPASKNPAPLNSYIDVTLHNLFLTLMDWRDVMDSQPGAAASAQQQPVISALRETIEVLEKTKQSFKSRELGELRKKLEELLKNSRHEFEGNS
jgi:YesN/AraC family two-component response regulator